jgi:hypothetical protein
MALSPPKARRAGLFARHAAHTDRPASALIHTIVSACSRRTRTRCEAWLPEATASESHDVVSTVHVDDFTGDPTAAIRSEKNASGTHLGDFDVAAKRRAFGV